MSSESGRTPEQLRALEYLERKGTRAPVESVRAEVAAAFDRFERRLESLSGIAAERRPTPDQWSLVEVVDHLVESHRPAVDQLNAVIDGVDPGPPIPAGLQSDDPMSKEWRETVRELAEVHAAFLAALSRADDSVTGTIPVAVVVKTAESGAPQEWIERLHWKAFAIGVKVHTLEHLAQVERVVALLDGEPRSD